MHPEKKRDLRDLAIVLAAALLAYGLSLLGTFVYDDIHSIDGNPAIASLGNALRFFVDPGLFSATGNRMYRPVLLLTFAVDHALGGGAAWAFKLTSLLLHAGSALLLLRLCRAYGLGRGPALACGVLFAVHPLASEAVNLVSARSELLLLFGVLVALHGHHWQLAGRRGGRWLLLLGTALACGSKETGVMLPLLLLLQEGLRRRAQPFTSEGGFVVAQPRGLWPLFWRLLPPALLVFGYLLARKAMFGSATVDLGRGHDGSDLLSGGGRDLGTQLLTMATLLPRALLQMLVPVGLSLDPPVTFHPRLDWQVVCGALGLLLLTGFGLRRMRQRPLRALGIAMAWLLALPWIVVPLNVVLAEHRLYAPLAGCLLVGVDVVVGFRTRRAGVLAAPPSGASAAKLPARASTVGFVSAALLLAGLSASRSLDYRDERLLWQPILAGRPDCFRAQWGLGLTLVRGGDSDGARAHLAAACALYPSNPSPRIEWVNCLLRLPADRAQPFLALQLAEQLVRQRPQDPYCSFLLAASQLAVGESSGDADYFAKAEQSALHCLSIGAPKGLVYRVAARSRQLRGDLDGALALLDTSIARGLDHTSVRLDRAEILRRLGRTREAEDELTTAMRQDPLDPLVQAAMRRQGMPAAPR